MDRTRIIARLDIKNEFVIKGIQLEGLRKVGDPLQLAQQYYEQGADEILFMDAVASLYERNNLFHIIRDAVQTVFVPITIGGGIRKMEDIGAALAAGADKIALNTAAVRNPEFITQAAAAYGAQCIVGSIEAKRKNGSWEAYVDNGREETGLDAIEWAKRLCELGAGEIMITSVDNDGVQRGMDVELIKAIVDVTDRPVIACGGVGGAQHVLQSKQQANPSAIAVASVLHYNKCSLPEIKGLLTQAGYPTR